MWATCNPKLHFRTRGKNCSWFIVHFTYSSLITILSTVWRHRPLLRVVLSYLSLSCLYLCCLYRDRTQTQSVSLASLFRSATTGFGSDLMFLFVRLCEFKCVLFVWSTIDSCSRWNDTHVWNLHEIFIFSLHIFMGSGFPWWHYQPSPATLVSLQSWKRFRSPHTAFRLTFWVTCDSRKQSKMSARLYFLSMCTWASLLVYTSLKFHLF